jgi:hypothetical protein
MSRQFTLVLVVLVLDENRLTRSAVRSMVSRTAGCLLGFGVLVFEHEFEDEHKKDKY